MNGSMGLNLLIYYSGLKYIVNIWIRKIQICLKYSDPLLNVKTIL